MDADIPADGTYCVVQYQLDEHSEWFTYCRGGSRAAKKVVEEMRSDPKAGQMKWRAIEVNITTTVKDW